MWAENSRAFWRCLLYISWNISIFLRICISADTPNVQFTKLLEYYLAPVRWISNCSIAKNKPRSRSGNWQYDMTAPHIFAHVYKCLHIVMVVNGKYNYKLYSLYIYMYTTHTHYNVTFIFYYSNVYYLPAHPYEDSQSKLLQARDGAGRMAGAV